MSSGGEDRVPEKYIGTFNAQTGEGIPVTIEISRESAAYFYCNQDMFWYNPPAFPAIPSYQPIGAEWMSSEQDFAFVLGNMSFAVIAVILILILNSSRIRIRALFVGVKEVKHALLSCN